MKIISLNLRGFVDWEMRYSKILAFLQAEDADVIVFQEVVYLPELSPFNQVEILNLGLGYAYCHSSITRSQSSPGMDIYREGLALLSKTPVRYTDALILHKNPADHLNRIIQLADIETPGGLIKFANIHFSFPETLGAEHLAETLGILASRGETRIVLGDFNMPHLERYKDVWGQNYRISSAVRSYISMPDEAAAIDYALIPKSDSFVGVEVSGDGLSDHRALTVEVTF